MNTSNTWLYQCFAESVAAMFLTTEAVVADKTEEITPLMPDMGGMGGMM